MTCKRIAGKTVEKWTLERHGRGVRVWDRVNLRPKRVFIRKA